LCMAGSLTLGKRLFKRPFRKQILFRERNMILSPPEAAAGRATSRNALAGFVWPLARKRGRAAHIIRKAGRAGLGG